LLGSSAEQHAILPAATVQQLAISPDDSNVFIALGAGGTVAIPFNSTNANPFGATLTKIPVKHTSGSALSVAVDPTNRVFYVGETLADTAGSGGGLRVFNYSSLATTLTEVSGSPYTSGGLAPNAILPDSTGTYAYVANGQGTTAAGNLAGFTLAASGTTYTLTAGATVAVGTDPVGLAEDSTNTYVLAVSSGGSPDLAAFSFDATTPGTLDSVLTASTGTDPVEAAAIVAGVQ
jgi:DNA-binding beta-propeller fold protein YncE